MASEEVSFVDLLGSVYEVQYGSNGLLVERSTHTLMRLGLLNTRDVEAMKASDFWVTPYMEHGLFLCLGNMLSLVSMLASDSCDDVGVC